MWTYLGLKSAIAFIFEEDGFITFKDEFVERVNEVRETTSVWNKMVPRLEQTFHAHDVDSDGILNITEVIGMFEAADSSSKRNKWPTERLWKLHNLYSNTIYYM